MSQAIMALDATAGGTGATGGLAAARARRRSHVLRPLLMLLGVLGVGLGLGYWWLSGGRTVSIDDAYVGAAMLDVSTDVSGIVSRVAVHEGQRVRRGDLLFQLNDRQYRIALDAARANLAQTVLNVDAMKRDYARLLHQADERRAQVADDQSNLNRMSPLLHSGGVARGQYDDMRYKLQADQQAVDALGVQAQVQLARLGGSAEVQPQQLPEYQAAQARVAEAQRELDHTVVRAPFSGIVTRVDALQPGQYLPASTAAFGLVSVDDVWAEGYPKETELTWVKDGDPARVTVDSYPGQVWRGTVESVAPASGSAFSVLPAQNTSGNWVKVVQRVPLRIRLDRAGGGPELRAGTSVVIDIDTGHTRSFRDLL
jgi:membrane fusion protein (multidrug efflux system)